MGRKKINISKKLLIKAYVEEQKSVDNTAKDLGYSYWVVYNRLKEFGLLRSLLQANKVDRHKKDCQCAWCKGKRGEYKGKESPTFIDGRCSKKYCCIDCGKEIGLTSALYGQGRCIKCNRKIIGIKFRGEKHWNYIDGRTLLKEIIRKSSEYNEWRNQIFARDNYTCQECFRVGGDLEVHHKKPFTELLSEFLAEYNQFSPYEEKEILARLAMKYNSFWDINNGITLCIECHSKIDKHRRIAIKR